MSTRARIITIIIIFALTVYAGMILYNFWGHYNDVQEELFEARREVVEMQQKIDDLEYRLAHIDDPDVIRRIAEEMLGLVSPDEIIITEGPDGEPID